MHHMSHEGAQYISVVNVYMYIAMLHVYSYIYCTDFLVIEIKYSSFANPDFYNNDTI